jgi:STE24 endopeptidase
MIISGRRRRSLSICSVYHLLFILHRLSKGIYLRIILLVLLFFVWETWSPAQAHWKLLSIHVGVPVFFSGYCLLILLLRLWGKRLAEGMIDGDPGREVDRFNTGMAVARALIPGWFAVGVFVLGWKPAVDLILAPVANWPVITPGTVVGLMPGFLGWMGLWWSQFPVDRALREQNALFQLEADLPVFAPSDFRGYFINKLRVQLLFSIVPLLLILALHDGVSICIAEISQTNFGQRWGMHLPLSDSADSAVYFVVAMLVLFIAPEILRHVLHTQRLPESNLRKSLAEISDRAGVSCREILLWRTQNNLGNAAVMGLIPRVRYVMLSDLLLESMTDLQIQAVFAHELGHVKHRHLAWFVVFFMLISRSFYTLLVLLEHHLKLSDNGLSAFEASSVLAYSAVLLVGFGFLSRWFERQADVYAARTLERGTVAEPLPSETSGASIFASALERVAVVNNIPIDARNWTHGSIQARMRFIKRLGRDPAVAARFDRTGKWVLFGLICTTILCGAIAIYGQIRG